MYELVLNELGVFKICNFVITNDRTLAVTASDGVMHELFFDPVTVGGAVSLSLDVADATLDAGNDTLSRSVSSQPWENRDKLMVPIRSRPPVPEGLTASELELGAKYLVKWDELEGAIR